MPLTDSEVGCQIMDDFLGSGVNVYVHARFSRAVLSDSNDPSTGMGTTPIFDRL